MTAARISATHVLCSTGRGTRQVWASARAGIGRIGSSHVMNGHREPIQMGLVPEAALGTLVPEVENLHLPSRAQRILRLAAPSFQTVATIQGRVPVFPGPGTDTRESAVADPRAGALQRLARRRG